MDFLPEKNYNRCKRLHLLFALKHLHFLKFIAASYDELHIANIQSLLSSLDVDENLIKALPLVVVHLIEDYEEFCEETKKVTHGFTARFWYTYIQMVELYF